MPDIITHYRFGEKVLGLLESGCEIERGIFAHATAGPDVWFSYRFWKPSAQRGRPARGTEMQHEKTGDFLRALARETKQSPARRELFSYLAGFLCHYQLDQTAHPYIIYFTGLYDGTEATLPNRGNHMRLEHALDWRELRRWGKSLSDRPITRDILRLRALPESLRDGLNAAYERVYGWRNVWAELNRAIGDQRRFYALAQDPSGVLDAVLRRVDNGRSHRDLTAISYHGKACEGVDVENEAHRLWRHPCDGTIESRESFAELTDRAAQKAAAMIAAAWAFVKDANAPLPVGAFGDASYETGFDWRDPRNQAARICDPLPLAKR